MPAAEYVGWAGSAFYSAGAAVLQPLFGPAQVAWLRLAARMAGGGPPGVLAACKKQLLAWPRYQTCTLY